MNDMDMVVRRVRLAERDGTWDIGVRNGRIVELAATIDARGSVELDAGGRLIAPTYVNGHVHLDKCKLGDLMRGANSLPEREQFMREYKRTHTRDDLLARASAAIEEGISNGTTVFRVFADVDTLGGLVALEAMLALRETWRDVVTIQVVNFPQEGIIREPGTFELMTEGMRMGADVVGGLPWYEHLDEDVRRHIDLCFELARMHDKDIHMIVDDTDSPNSRSLEYLAVKTMREGYQGRVSASHCAALAAYDEVHAQKVMELVERAGVSISANPHVSLVARGRSDQEPIRRGITRVKQLWRMGVNVFSSQDDITDLYYPFGRNDQQEVASFVCHGCHMTEPNEIRAAFDFVTGHAARALRLADYGLDVGCRADFNVLAGPTIQEVLRLQRPPRWVVRNGRVLASNETKHELHK